MRLAVALSQNRAERCPACGGDGIVSNRNADLIRRFIPESELGTMPDLGEK